MDSNAGATTLSVSNYLEAPIQVNTLLFYFTDLYFTGGPLLVRGPKLKLGRRGGNCTGSWSYGESEARDGAILPLTDDV